MAFFPLKISLPMEVSVLGWEVGVFLLGVLVLEWLFILGLEVGAFLLWGLEKEAFSLLKVVKGVDMLEEAGVSLLLEVVEVLLLPATWRGGRGFSHGERSW